MTEYTPKSPPEEFPSSQTEKKYRTGIIVLVLFFMALGGMAIYFTVGDSELPEAIDPVAFTPEAEGDDEIVELSPADEAEDVPQRVGQAFSVDSLTYRIDKVSIFDEFGTEDLLEISDDDESILVVNLTVINHSDQPRRVSLDNVELRDVERRAHRASAPATAELEAIVGQDLGVADAPPAIPTQIMAAFVIPDILVADDFTVVVLDRNRPELGEVEVLITTDDLQTEVQFNDLI